MRKRFFYGALFVIAVALFNTFGITKVVGRSMEPTYYNKDHLLYCKHMQPQPGDVIIVRDPLDSRDVLIKRVMWISSDEVYVLGDNRDNSEDSRTFGSLPTTSILGVVLFSR